MTDIAELKEIISALKKENTYLKSLLDNAGISYTEVGKRDDNQPVEEFAVDQGARILPVEITISHARKFLHISGAAWMFSVNAIKIKIPVKQDIFHSVIISGVGVFALKLQAIKSDVRIALIECGPS